MSQGETCQTRSMPERLPKAPPGFFRRRVLATGWAVSALMMASAQPGKLTAQTFADEQGSISSETTRTVSRDVIEFGMVLKELKGPGLTYQPCNKGRLVLMCEPIGWLPQGAEPGWRDLRIKSAKELENGVPDHKVRITPQNFRSQGFAFWSPKVNFVPPSTQAGIMGMAAPAGSLSTMKWSAPAGTAELDIVEGQPNPWRSNWYETTSREPDDNPIVPTIKYTGAHYDGGLAAGTVACVANWNGNGWTWLGFHAGGGSLRPRTPTSLGYDYGSMNGAANSQTAGLHLQWNFVVVTRKRVDTKLQKRSDPASNWVDVPGSEKTGAWSRWTNPSSQR